MARVKKSNRITTISDSEVAEYTANGYTLLEHAENQSEPPEEPHRRKPKEEQPAE